MEVHTINDQNLINLIYKLGRGAEVMRPKVRQAAGMNITSFQNSIVRLKRNGFIELIVMPGKGRNHLIRLTKRGRLQHSVNRYSKG